MEGTYQDRAGNQSVRWTEWRGEIHRSARNSDKPLFAVSGVIWSQLCRQLDAEAFLDGDTADFINSNFVPIRLDRDVLPDVDAQFQRVVRLISGDHGWPIFVFLTPDEHPFFGGTYYPKQATADRPSFKRVLESVADAWANHPNQVRAAASELAEALGRKRVTRKLNLDLVTEGLEVLTRQYDTDNGGFRENYGKLLWPGALQLLLAAHRRFGDRQLLSMVENTLTHVGRGAIFDQIGGGFHHRSHDDTWLVPSFEKLLSDNAEMLRLYLMAYELTGNKFFAHIARSTIDYMFQNLADPNDGGFFASQAWCESYYTWTTEDVMKAVPFEYVKAIGHHLHFRPKIKNVPYRALDASTIASRYSDESENEIGQQIRKGLEFLQKARLRRDAPFTDRRIFPGWNVRACEAFFLADRILGRKDCSEFATATMMKIEGQDRLAVFDEVEDYFGPSRMALSIAEHRVAPIDALGPSHGSLLLAVLESDKTFANNHV
jgi:uncharacterized protein